MQASPPRPPAHRAHRPRVRPLSRHPDLAAAGQPDSPARPTPGPADPGQPTGTVAVTVAWSMSLVRTVNRIVHSPRAGRLISALPW